MSLSHRRHLVLLFETQTMKSKNFKADENWLPWSNPSQSHPSTLAPRCYIHLRRCYAPCVNRCHSLSQDREKVMKAWLLSVVDQAPEVDEAGGDQSNSSSSTEKRKKQLEKKALETEELPFLLQSGVLLCRLLKFKNQRKCCLLKVCQPAPTFQWHRLLSTSHRDSPCQEKQHQVTGFPNSSEQGL